MTSHLFETLLANSWPPGTWADMTVMLAVSGGADSVALLRAVEAIRPARSQGRLIVAHYNHRLRAEHSDEDERFVAGICRHRGLPCVCERFQGDWSERDSEGFEAAARDARYDFLRRTACRFGARLVATAHTADDQVETVLHRIMRGTGIAGLAGIPRTRELLPGIAIIRPMLQVTRQQVEDYLRDIHQSYRTDASNADRQYTRNRIRHDLLPLLETKFGLPVRDSIGRLSLLAGELQQVVDTQVDTLYDAAVVERSNECVAIDRRKLEGVTRYLVRELLVRIWQQHDWPLRDMGLREWELLADLAIEGRTVKDDGRTATKRMLPGGVTAEVEGDRLAVYVL